MTDRFLVNCGGHLATGLPQIKRELGVGEDYFVHTFEPNPAYAEGYKGIQNHVFHQKAIWIYDGMVNLYLQPGFYSQGHSLCKEKTNVEPDNYVVVECVDFGKWLRNTFAETDYVIVRMDIEGGEYKVLNSIIKDGSINYINHLIVEFHHRKHTLIATEEEYQSLLLKIKIPFEGFFSIKHRK
ncbi:MAG: FkbM family methyltransferase [Planctomycetota bacterium]|jgi:FkbM family methyltransferase